MNLKVSDAEFSLATDRMTAGVESLVDISRDYVAIVEELTSRGHQLGALLAGDGVGAAHHERVGGGPAGGDRAARGEDERVHRCT